MSSKQVRNICFLRPWKLISVSPLNEKTNGGVFRTLSSIWDGAFCENSYRFSTVNYFCKSSILDVWQGPERASDAQQCFLKCSNTSLKILSDNITERKINRIKVLLCLSGKLFRSWFTFNSKYFELFSTAPFICFLNCFLKPVVSCLAYKIIHIYDDLKVLLL